jgi:hypothetical protein
MSRGGHRQGAGRPKGSRDKMPRRPTAPPPDDPAAEKAFLEACAAFVATGEPFRILRDFLESEDPSRRAWALDKILSYGVGLPAKRPDGTEVSGGRLEDMTEAELEALIARLLASPSPPPQAVEAPAQLKITDGSEQ